MMARHIVRLVFLVLLPATESSAEEVSTLAGTGVADYGGDGGPALAAALNAPWGVAVAPDGTVYLSDLGNYRIRRITPDGTIDTVAGTGVYGYDGNGGPATSASLADVVALAFDPTGNAVLLADTGNREVRRVDLDTGTIDAVATLEYPQGIAVDPTTGYIFVAETLLCRLVIIDPVNYFVTPFAGEANECSISGDGGPMGDATFAQPRGLAMDAASNFFVIDTGPPENFPQSDRVRRIDLSTGIVTTVAGGGTSLPGTGPATDMDLGLVKAIAVDATPGGAQKLLIAGEYQIFIVDLASGQMAPWAGTGVSGFLDGPALDAQFNVMGGIAFSAHGELVVGDAFNNRLRRITPLGGVWLGDLTFGTGETTIGAPGVTQVTGSVSINGNEGATVIDLSGLANVVGGIDMNGNTGATVIDLSGLVSTEGLISINDNTAATVIDLSALDQNIYGVSISGNTAATVIDLSAMAFTGGVVIVKNNGSASLNIGNLGGLGWLDVESTGTGTFDASACAVDMTTIDARGYRAVLATTAFGGPTNVRITDDSQIAIALPYGASDCRNFSMGRVVAEPEAGMDENDTAVLLDTVDIYLIEFDDGPPLAEPATIVFEIILANLLPERQVEVLDALDTGMLRLVSRGEGEPVTQAFRLCADGEPQEFVDGCVVLTRLDENGIPTNSATPARIRFTQITQTFPAWSVAIVQEDDDGDIDGIVDSFDNCLLVPNGPSHTDAGGHSQRDTDDDGFGNLCDADLNGTGLVTAADFNLLRSCLNQSAGSSALCAAADMNGSGLVTTADFSLLRPRLNTAPGPSGLHN